MSSDIIQHEEQESTLDLGQIIAIGKRRFIFFLIPSILVGVVAIAVTYLLPQRYESAATVLVESQQIPVELVQSTVTSDPNQRITIIKQRVMTRKNLLRIIDKYNVFSADRKKLSVTKIVEQMQKLVTIDIITADTNRGRGTTIAFKLSFQNESPEIATKVANELVTLFLSENVKTRTARATETTDFLGQEANKLKKTLVEAEAAISAYKRENNENLPEHLNLRLNRLERNKSEINTLELQISSLREQRRYLDVELASALSGEGTAFGDKDEKAIEAEKELDKLKDVMIESSVRLTDSHPDMKSLRRRIAVLEEKLADEKAAASESESKNTPPTPKSGKAARLIERLQIGISSNTRNIKKYEEDLIALRQKILDIEKRILKTPEVERGLVTLSRNHQEIFQKYTELQAKQGTAQLAQNLEEEKKAERFILLEAPVLPTEPVWPNRIKFLGIGGFLAFASGIGTALLVELIDKRIRTAAQLEALLRHPPLVSIPYIKTQRDIQKKRYKIGMTLVIPFGLFLGGLATVHYFYKPLDVLFYRIWVYLDKLNLLPF